MTVSAPVKKKKVAIRHARAISGYKNWLKQNPKAGRKRRIQQFDLYVDSALLAEEIEKL